MDFVKMQGTGNDFVVVDNRDGHIADPAAFARRVCPRGTAVGADGVLLLEPSASCDARMRIINADGSEAEMCGNGARCFARFAHAIGAAGKDMTVQTLAGTIRATVTDEGARVQMIDALRPRCHAPLPCGKHSYAQVWHVDTGVPHAVVPVDDIGRVDVNGEGRALRHHPAFAPRGTNVNFIQRLADDTLAIRTYERGVEAETLACGTGSTAAALVAHALWQWPSPVRLRTHGADMLTIHFRPAPEGYADIFLEGPVVTVYRGTLLLP